MSPVPKGWLNYTAYGSVIAATRILPFKVPLRATITYGLKQNQQFDLTDLLRKFPAIGLVVDLTQTTRYYDPEVLRSENISYKKIFCQGHGQLPKDTQIRAFIDSVHQFTVTHPDKLVGVHCTHGLNRTGFMICKYMIEKMSMDPTSALEAFESARGHKIERMTYIEELTGKNKSNLDAFESHKLARNDSNDDYQSSSKLRVGRQRQRSRSSGNNRPFDSSDSFSSGRRRRYENNGSIHARDWDYRPTSSTNNHNPRSYSSHRNFADNPQNAGRSSYDYSHSNVQESYGSMSSDTDPWGQGHSSQRGSSYHNSGGGGFETTYSVRYAEQQKSYDTNDPWGYHKNNGRRGNWRK